MLPFDPDFDDARWTLDWARVPILQIPTGRHPTGFVVVEREMRQSQIFDRVYEAREPFPVRALVDSDGKLWMSDTPQERMMMYNNAAVSHGHILIGGLGLAMYPQYAAARARRFTIVEHSRAVAEIVAPTLGQALTERPRPVLYDIKVGDVEAFLAAEPTTRYDTIFLDTWPTLDARLLPQVNRLRDLAIRHLAPEGRVLLWGYRWMVRLFEDACRQLLSVPPAGRGAWLAHNSQPEAAQVLQPVLAHFSARPVDDMDSALEWCHEFIVANTESA